MTASNEIHESKAFGSFDLSAYLSERRRIIDRQMELLLEEQGAPSRLHEAMHYSLMGQGKRLRPVLCIAAAEAVGGNITPSVLRTACALEMIHTYSLIHDDLPAMDDDALRRGRPTCHVCFDEATAILAGDGLLTLAFEVLAGSRPENDDSKNAAETQLRVISVIAAAAGSRGMIEGQMRDMFAQGKQTDAEALRKIHAFKTGAIIEASVVSGALCGGGSENQVEALAGYARNIGLAFQVADDILNVEGDPEVMGKSTGTDRMLQKATYPGLLGLEESKRYAGDLVANALQSLAIFDNKAAPLYAVARYVVERNR